jgi:aspartate racemase
VLFQANTVSQLALLIDKQGAVQSSEWSMLIPIQPSGTRPPLFCVARPNVNALGYLFLSRELGRDQPVYGLQVQLEEDPSIDFSDEQIQSTAVVYIEAMKTVQPHGPYQLIGQCQGAYIAFEMARQLEAVGEEVSFLGTLDAWTEENTRYRWRFKVFLAFRRLQALKDRIFRGKNHSVSTQLLDNQASDRSAPPSIAGSSLTKQALFKKYFPGKAFIPPVCSAPITVFRLRDQPWYRKNDLTMGWGQRTRSGVKVRNISGHHLTILRHPFVDELASHLSEFLTDCGPGVG